MKKQLILSVVILIILVTNLYAEEFTGDDIAYKVFNRDDGEDSYSRMEMVLIDKKGSERKRILNVYNKDYNQLSKSFIRFLSPADIEGTGFLSWENEEGDDTQYLYLPDLGRSRRIVSSQRDLRFVNSDFTYEDMQRRKAERDNHQLLQEEEWRGWPCYVVEYIPIDKNSSQYSKLIQWIDKASFIPVQIEFYNKKGKLFKRLAVDRLEKIDGIWTAMSTLMDDFKENHKTRMAILEVSYNKGIEDEIFTLHNMEDY